VSNCFGGATVAHQSNKLKVLGSNPSQGALFLKIKAKEVVKAVAKP